MADKLMYIIMIHKIIPCVDLWLKVWNILKLTIKTKQSKSTKYPKLFSQRIRKSYHNTLGTSIITSWGSPLPPCVYILYYNRWIWVTIRGGNCRRRQGGGKEWRKNNFYEGVYSITMKIYICKYHNKKSLTSRKSQKLK